MKVTISKLFIFSLLAMAIKSAHSAAALPTGEKIIHGEVSISRGPNSMFISSNTDRNVISWNDFSVAKGNSVVFTGTDATFLNIVKSSNISVIDGNVSSIGNNNIYLSILMVSILELQDPLRLIMQFYRHQNSLRKTLITLLTPVILNLQKKVWER